MTEKDNQSALDKLKDSRREFMKKGAAATAGAGVLASGTGSVAAQTDDNDDEFDDQEWDKAIIAASHFQPRSRFVITSPVLKWSPSVDEIQDNVWSEYNTRMIRYLNTNEQVPYWQAHEAEVPDFDQKAGYVVDAEGETGPNNTPQPEIFRMHPEGSIFGASGFVTVNFTPVSEDEQDDLLDDDDWWYEDDEDAVGLDDI